MGIQIFLIIFLIVLNGIFAASEIALVSANRREVQEDAESSGKKGKKAKVVLKLIENPTKFLSTIQIGITMFGFINGVIAADAFSSIISNSIANWTSINIQFITPVVTIFITLILTYFQVIFGELVPKRIAMKAPVKVAYLFVGFLQVIALFMRPFVLLLTSSANLVMKLLGINPSDDDDTLSEEELILELNASESRGFIDSSENEMIQNIFEFDSTTVEEVMTHRTEVSAINVNSLRDELIEYVTNEKYTRFPVYEETLDKIVGTLHVKDLLKYLRENPDPNIFNIHEILRDPLFVPQSKNTRELFKEMKLTKTHIAIVIDEYGGTAGIITLEDLIEEILGNISDEYDEDDIEIQVLNENQYEIDGLIDLDDVEDLLSAGLPVDDYDTLSGFILGQLGRFPDEDEAIIVVFNNYRFEVLKYLDKIIERVLVTRIENSENNTDTLNLEETDA
ncbi:hemolysin family protein [Acholeplasma granularum]|uniref:hemolysin family protein n=1 Tax=Acholeplasma granularum TaxID=264635 RepID=UPI00046EDBE7|nr:hemolysin family protein [Acholeplasma granularum]